MDQELQGALDAFFAAMANGYAEDAPKTAIPELPGAKAIHFECGDYLVVDYYFTTHLSDKSAGQTMMWRRGHPRWVMCYGGWYAKVAIPFLKECLHRAYVTERRFYGGRGPFVVRGERFTYVNTVRRNHFEDFEGEERVSDFSGQDCGYHWYRGMSLLKE